MNTYAIYQLVQHGSRGDRTYLGKCESAVNLSRIRGVAGFINSDGDRYPNERICFSADKAAHAMLPHLELVEVDELGNCDFHV